MSDIEQVRDYWNANPCNIRHSKAPVGTQEYFDQVEYRKYKVEPHIPGFANFPEWAGLRVLEVGCGIGTDAVNFVRHGASYTGIELSKASLDLCAKRLDVYNIPNPFTPAFYGGNAEELLDGGLFGKEFDLVYSFGVVHHTPNPQRLIDGMRSVLRVGGELRMMVYATNSFKGIMIREGLEQPESRRGCPIAHTYTSDEVFQMCKAFSRVSIEQTHIFPYDIEKYINHQYEMQPWFGHMPKQMFAALEKHLGWHLLVKAFL